MQLTNAELRSDTIMDRARERGKNLWGFLTSNPKLLTGLGIIAFFVLMALLAPLLTPYDPGAFSKDSAVPPFVDGHILGTTRHGEDIFAQIVYGARVSLTVGFLAALGSTVLQVLFGLTAGYFGGLVDDILTVITNIFLVLPGLPLTIVIASFAPVRNETIITLILLFTSWSYGARVLRAQTLSMREREFVAAARASGETPLRLIFAEILPNEIALVASNFVGTFVYTVGAEVALEFLGLGDVTRSSWGVILYWAQLNQALLAGNWWLFVPAGLCVALLCSGLTFVNFGIDEIANPRLRREKVSRGQATKKDVMV